MSLRIEQRATNKNKVRNILLALLAVSLIACVIAYNNVKNEQKAKSIDFTEGTKIGAATIVKLQDQSFKIKTEEVLFDLSSYPMLLEYKGRQLSDGRYFVWKSGNYPLPAGYFSPKSPEKGIKNTIVASTNSGLEAELFSLSPSGNFAAISAVQSKTGSYVITIADTTTGKTILTRKLEAKDEVNDIAFCEEKQVAFLTYNGIEYKLYTIKFF